MHDNPKQLTPLKEMGGQQSFRMKKLPLL